MSKSPIEELREKAFTRFGGMQVVPLSTAEEIVSTLVAENERLETKLVDLALELAHHVTAEDRRRILESEDVRSIMDLRLR